MTVMRATRKLLLLLVSSSLLAGCTLVKLKEESRSFYSSTVLVGRIDAPPNWDGAIIVAAFTRTLGRIETAHQALLHEAGGYELIVEKGEYGLFAFGDRNNNRIYDPGEPAGEYPGSGPVVASGQGVIAGLDIALIESPQRSLSLAPGTAFDVRLGHSTQAGALANLDAPVFSAANGNRAYWAPMEFFKETGGNIYFLGPYDPQRIPVLFVHGAAGSPQDWRYFFDHLDRTRYQPWFFFYPSGASLDSMAYLLFWKLFNLQARYPFERIHLTAHSMGGLVVRTFLLNHGSQFPQAKLFVTLSTPWAGEPSAEIGVKHSPAVVPSWNDMQPDGRFMKTLFERPLPSGIDHYLLFGHKGGYSMLRPNNDGTVTLASQLRSPAQAEARMVFGFDEDHVSILSSAQVFAHYQTILAGADKRDSGAPSGRLRVDFRFDGNDTGPKALPLLVLDPVGGAAQPVKSRLTITLSPDGNGRDIGPVPAGDYEAAMFAGSFRTEPRRLRVRIDPGRVPSASFRLIAQGALSGYVGADVAPADNPAGSLLPPHKTIRIVSITLAGSAGKRTLTPRTGGGDDLIDAYLDGRDDARGAFFSFVDLAPGNYELTIIADGYRPHRSSHTVEPGRPAQLSPIAMTPL
ncbi:MAG: alpha/beta hydrolase [Burkholderiaceae bacterium]|nr:alpha/beta hydrolase [Burkholderiaceae bacterium]